MTRRNELRAGFTLVEILVVVVIAAIVMAILVSVLGSSFEILRKGQTRSQLIGNCRTALDYLSDSISSASYIPLSSDRDLNAYPDDMYELDLGGSVSQVGYGPDAVWRVAQEIGDDIVLDPSYWMSEAWSDRLMVTHRSDSVAEGGSYARYSSALPRALRTPGGKEVFSYTSLFRLAIPADNRMPYYLAGEWDRNADGVLDATDLLNSGSGNPNIAGDGNGEIPGYPEYVPVGPHKESAAVIQDLFYTERGQTEIKRIRQIPIANNITRVKYEYLHEVPVFFSRSDGAGSLQIAYQHTLDGTVGWYDPTALMTGDIDDNDAVPLISHWELKVIDVAYNRNHVDPDTDAIYFGISHEIADQYPEGLNDAKRSGTHLTGPNGRATGGLGIGWGMGGYYSTNINLDPDEAADNAPLDRFAFTTVDADSNEGGFAMLRPDMGALHGLGYLTRTADPVGPTGIGDMGDADGIPDGDGIPDDPVPGWWLPYMRAVRVTVVATPQRIIEERMAMSGSQGSTGSAVYFRLDSPVPYADTNRIQPLYNQHADYVGEGEDIILTKTVPVDYVYRLELAADPRDANTQGLRRADYNFFRGRMMLISDPLGPDKNIVARTPYEKYVDFDVPNE